METEIQSASISQPRQGNIEIRFKKLLNGTNVWRQGTKLKYHIVSYFINFFTYEVFEPEQAVLSHVRRRISADMTDAKPFTGEGVRKTLFDIGVMKALVPDVLQSVFHRRSHRVGAIQQL